MLHRAKSFSTCLRELTWFSPLYHTTSMIRIIWGEEVIGLSFHLIWLIGLAHLLTVIPMYMLNLSYYR